MKKSMRDEVEVPLWKKKSQSLKNICIKIIFEYIYCTFVPRGPRSFRKGGETSQSIITTLHMASNKVHRVVFLYVPVLDS